MSSLLELIPGYKEAVRLENQSRDLSFLSHRENICGMEVLSMNLKHFILLDGIRSPFLYERLGDPADAVMFLWILSPEWKPTKCREKKRLIKRCRRLNYGQLTKEILEYVKQTFQDSPSGRTGEEYIPFMSCAAVFVDRLASQYGWTDETILNVPLRRLFQYQRAIRKRLDPKAILFNESDKVRGQWLAQSNGRN